MITIAGSGPSTGLIDHVDVATKKQSVPSDYVFCRFAHSCKTTYKPLILYYKRPTTQSYAQYVDGAYWNSYYKRFVTTQQPPQRTKPSTGLCAVFAVMEIWKPETIGLIGYDWVIDGNPDWEHDADAERRCILSLTNLKDLRNGQLIEKHN